MTKKTTYNIDQIVSVTLVDKKESLFCKRIRRVFMPDKYLTNGLDIYSEEQLISQGYLVQDGKVYYKPYVQVSYSNGETCKMEHDTMEVATKEYEKLCKTINKSIEL